MEQSRGSKPGFGDANTHHRDLREAHFAEQACLATGKLFYSATMCATEMPSSFAARTRQLAITCKSMHVDVRSSEMEISATE